MLKMKTVQKMHCQGQLLTYFKKNYTTCSLTQGVTPTLPRNKPVGLVNQCVPGSRKLYNTLIILLHLMGMIAPNHIWRSRVKDLLSEHEILLTAMGFPVDWEKRKIWRLW